MIASKKRLFASMGDVAVQEHHYVLVSLIHWIFKFTFVWYKLFHFTLSCWPFITFVSCINPSNSWRVWRPTTKHHSFPRLSPPNRKTVTFSCSRSLFSICSLGTLRILKGHWGRSSFQHQTKGVRMKGLPFVNKGTPFGRLRDGNLTVDSQSAWCFSNSKASRRSSKKKRFMIKGAIGIIHKSRHWHYMWVQPRKTKKLLFFSFSKVLCWKCWFFVVFS